MIRSEKLENNFDYYKCKNVRPVFTELSSLRPFNYLTELFNPCKKKKNIKYLNILSDNYAINAVITITIIIIIEYTPFM